MAKKDPTLVLTPEMKKDASRTALLMCVSGANDDVKGGHNKYYNMFITGGRLIIEHGRVGVESSRKLYEYPTDRWDELYRGKTQKRSGESYRDVSNLRTKSDYGFGGIEAPIAHLLRTLISASTLSVAKNYSIASEDVTQAMIDAAQSVVDAMHANLTSAVYSVKQLNKQLLELYATLPRQIDNVQRQLFTDNTSYQELQRRIGDEQQLLDTMRGAVAALGTPDQNQNVLQALGIEIHCASPEERARVRRHAAMILDSTSYSRQIYELASIYAVNNIATRGAFEERRKTLRSAATMELWSGSRTQNWLSILKSGLLIRPAGAVHTGSMYGDAVYFSSNARKSLGYTSVSGSRWAHGSNNEGYMGLFEVATGMAMTVYSSDTRLNLKRVQLAGYDSVHAPAGSAVRNDERMIYHPAQSTIKFLVEVRPTGRNRR